MLDEKIKKYFENECVHKTTKNYSIFGGKNIPSFIKDWLVKRYSDEFGNVDSKSINNFLKEHMPSDDKTIKKEIWEGEDKKILARLIIEPDIKKDILKFSIPDIGIKFNETKIEKYVAKKHKELKSGEVWGVVTLTYNNNEKEKFIELVDFKSFSPYKVDLDFFKKQRKNFTTEEWVDLLIRAMEYNPDGFSSMGQKTTFLSRLLVFVEPRVNLIELAPKGTGKSYIFGNLSKFGWLISGGVVTRAKLLYDVAKQMPGVIINYDYVAMDEIQTITLKDESEITGGLKSFLESGTFTIANVRQTSNAGFIILGNIPLDENNNPIVRSYFEPLPEVFRESAFLDRFHGFIEGWKMPRMNQSMILDGNTLNVEYFSEILHLLRDDTSYSPIVDSLLDIPSHADTRDVNAVKRLTTAYLKLLFPHVKSIDDIDIDEFKLFCFDKAYKKRDIMRKQIHKIDREFSKNLPNITVIH
ncbi:MAG: BREX system Lon protease-like protein BrxL [Sulfurospirillum sp.]|nr:BREX system Lon protease-like protein BrxL [Sulfurospirillum sp.]